uniref:Uncharacterized protein n=1 Tax=Paramormyrops kingsleyae TaxID=1676925 RepID=A0A3B3R1L9_9TELE
MMMPHQGRCCLPLLAGSRHCVHLNCLPEGRDRHPVIQMNMLCVAATVVSLWDFMRHLKLSQHQRHNDLFLDLAQRFWELYAYCVLSGSHTRAGRYRKYSVNGRALYRTVDVKLHNLA